MSNPNEPKNYGREVRQESYNDVDGHTHTHVTRTSETVNNVSNPNAYSDGYVEGRVDENLYQGEVLAERDNENAGRGLLLGILLTSLAALTAGTIWYFNQRDDVDPVPTIVLPNSQPAPSPSPEAKQETTIIERTRDVPVPVVVPQQQAPAPQAPAPQAPAPDINISVPNSVTQPPATQEAPATQPAPTESGSQSSSTSESQSSSTDTQGTQSSTDTTTPTEGTSSQTGTTSGSTPTGGGSTGDSPQ